MSNDQRTDLPPVNSSTFNEKVREAISTYLGKRGDKLDRGVTLRDLVDAGIAELRSGYLSGNKGGPRPITGPGGSIEPVYEADLTPPPTPTGFSVSSAITTFFVQHDSPTYSAGHGHARTNLYGKIMLAGDPLPLFTDAQKISEFTGSVFSYATNPSTTWRLWIKWVSADGVESVLPAGGANGLEVITGQDVSLLLDALNGQITSSELNAALSSRIDLVDGSSSLAGSVNQRVATEATARAVAVAAENTSRIVNQTEQARLRTDQLKTTAEAVLRNVLATDKERLAKDSSVAYAKQELTETVVAGLATEASLRTTLEAKVDTNNTNALAAVSEEATARSTADAAEATQRNLLAAQFRGTYTGTDVNSVTEGLIYQERVARAAQDSSLAQQITLLSAGAGEQFDYDSIWYFDTGTEGWTGNGTPTVTSGFLRPANQASSAYVVSPGGLGIDGTKYGQVRLRARKTGTPTWGGFLYWRTVADSTWDISRRVALTEPTWDVNGIGLVTVSPGWAVSIDVIRVDLSDAQTTPAGYEVDWVAVGRPSPGASSAQITDEQTARVAGDAAVALTVTTLSAQVNNATTGLPAAHTAITTEASTRATADSAQATATTNLTSRVTTAEGNITTNASAISTEATTRSNADTTLTNSISALSSTVTDPNTGLSKTRSDLIATQNTLATATATSARDTKELFSSSGVIDAATLREVLTDDANKGLLSRNLASAQQQLSTGIVTGLASEAAARLALAAIVDTNTAAITSEATARSTADGAITTSLNTLSSQVNNATTGLPAAHALIVSEATTRATTDSALASSISTLSVTVGNNTSAISTEATTRADADSALSTSITTLSSQVNNPTTGLPAAYTAISTEATTRADETGDLFAQYTVKLDTNGYVSGFGLASTLTNAIPFSQFIFKADQFAFGAPGRTNVYPFVIQATATTVNGVAVPAGVYIDAAYIKNGTITSLKIGDSNITTANIANGAITTAKIGDLEVTNAKIGSFIQSDNYVAGSAGWAIAKSGSAEFNTGTFRGALAAATGTFAGSLSAAAGTFVGTLTAGTTPAVSGTSMTGSGGVINTGGTFALGNSSKNISFNGSSLTVNGDVITTGNLTADSVTKSYGILYSNNTGAGTGEIVSASIGSAVGTKVSITGGGVALGAVVITVRRYDGANQGNSGPRPNLVVLVPNFSVPANIGGGGLVFSIPPVIDTIGISNYTYTYEIWQVSGAGVGVRSILMQEFKR